jgi:GMP synthase-like glutamine amidotransferase
MTMTYGARTDRTLVLQHLAAEGPGAIGHLLTAAGMSLTVVELDEGEPIPAALDEFDFMVVMGGPMDVWQESQYPWMAAEKAAIRRWVSELGRPFLGVCLGHQLLADALGGEVGPMTKPEIGLMEIALTEAGSADPAFGRIPSRFYGLQWHGAQVRRPPPGGVVLASNGHCAIQALRVGRWAWGVQFHLEVSEDTVSQWSLVPEYGATLESLGHGDADWLAAAVTSHLPTMRHHTDKVVSAIVTTMQHERARRTGAAGAIR